MPTILFSLQCQKFMRKGPQFSWLSVTNVNKSAPLAAFRDWFTGSQFWCLPSRLAVTDFQRVYYISLDCLQQKIFWSTQCQCQNSEKFLMKERCLAFKRAIYSLKKKRSNGAQRRRGLPGMEAVTRSLTSHCSFFMVCFRSLKKRPST